MSGEQEHRADGGNGEDDGGSGREFAPVVELAEAFTELVRAFGEEQSVGLTPEALVRLTRRCVPNAQHTGLIVLERGRQTIVAQSGPVVARLEEIRAQTGQGPALDVLEINDLVYAGDLIDDPRWPDFGARAAAEAGVRSVASYRLYLGPDHRAALTVCSDWPYAFDETALAVGAIFAAYCSLVLFTEVVLNDRLTPRRAAQVHREIGVAVGILIATDPAGTMDTHQAYQRLRAASEATRRSLHEVAGQVIAERGLFGDADPDAEDDPADR